VRKHNVQIRLPSLVTSSPARVTLLSLMVIWEQFWSYNYHNSEHYPRLRECYAVVLARTEWRNIPEDGILHSHRHSNVKSYIALTVCAL
jgi:hypothetical protein